MAWIFRIKVLAVIVEAALSSMAINTLVESMENSH